MLRLKVAALPVLQCLLILHTVCYLWNILFMAPRIKMIVNFQLTSERVCRKE